MLDAATLTNQATVYRATDPAQMIYRALLAGYTEAQLMQLDDEIATYSSTGLLPSSVEALLNAAEPAVAA